MTPATDPRAGLESSEIGLDHLGIALHGKQQGHIDTVALADHGGDGGQAGGGTGDFYVQVGRIDGGGQPAAGSDGAVGVMGQAGGHLHRHEPVDPATGIVDRTQDGQGAADVGGDQLPVGVLDAGTAPNQLTELVVIVGGGFDGLLKDGGIGGDAAHAPVDPTGELSVGDPAPLEVVEPGTLALMVVKVVQSAHGCSRVGSDGKGGPTAHPTSVAHRRVRCFRGVPGPWPPRCRC